VKDSRQNKEKKKGNNHLPDLNAFRTEGDPAGREGAPKGQKTAYGGERRGAKKKKEGSLIFLELIERPSRGRESERKTNGEKRRPRWNQMRPREIGANLVAMRRHVWPRRGMLGERKNCFLSEKEGAPASPHEGTRGRVRVERNERTEPPAEIEGKSFYRAGRKI